MMIGTHQLFPLSNLAKGSLRSKIVERAQILDDFMEKPGQAWTTYLCTSFIWENKTLYFQTPVILECHSQTESYLIGGEILKISKECVIWSVLKDDGKSTEGEGEGEGKGIHKIYAMREQGTENIKQFWKVGAQNLRENMAGILSFWTHFSIVSTQFLWRISESQVRHGYRPFYDPRALWTSVINTHCSCNLLARFFPSCYIWSTMRSREHICFIHY